MRRLAAIGRGRAERTGAPQLVEPDRLGPWRHLDDEDVCAQRDVELYLRQREPQIEGPACVALIVDARYANRARHAVLVIAELITPPLTRTITTQLRRDDPWCRTIVAMQVDLVVADRHDDPRVAESPRVARTVRLRTASQQRLEIRAGERQAC